jgi:uncharacterized protein (DUF433 family)
MAEAEYVIFVDGDYYIRESRITLASIVYPFREGLSAETIREEFSDLRLDQVYGALAYYLANQQIVDAYLQAKDHQFGKLAADQPHLSQQLRERIRTAKAQKSA